FKNAHFKIFKLIFLFRYLKLKQLLQTLQDVWSEIRQFNGSFWSSFIFCIWSSFTVNISLFLYTAMFSKVDLSVRAIMWLVLCLEIFSISALCLIASSVNKKARQLYFALNSLNLRIQNNQRNRFKVNSW